MKVLALALMLSLTAPRMQPPAKLPPAVGEHAAKPKGGRWYFAASGHAVYCYGPVKIVQQAHGGLQRVATFCQGDRLIVPLKD